MKIDTHVHTYYSIDSSMKPEDLITTAQARGLDAVVVLDHGTIKGALETRDMADGSGLLIIPGEEIDTRSGEIIALGIDTDIEQGMGLVETCKEVKKQGGFIIVPHPYDRFRSGVGDNMLKVLPHIDAVEAFNSRTLSDSFNRKGMELAQRHGIPVVAGSDAHFPNEIGNAYTVLDCDKTATIEEVLSAIRKNKARLVTKKTGLKRYPRTLALKLSRGLRNQK